MSGVLAGLESLEQFGRFDPFRQQAGAESRLEYVDLINWI